VENQHTERGNNKDYVNPIHNAELGPIRGIRLKVYDSVYLDKVIQVNPTIFAEYLRCHPLVSWGSRG
jgi:hypothetical protein